ncbi:MAG: chain-length determining protein [Planctomycetaceae bacterium]|nr:MAG: chain-length determining protein [Planctomycetaceae bacterium]
MVTDRITGGELSQHQGALGEMLRFLQVVRLYKWTMLGCLMIACGAATAHYIMAPRYYESYAEVLVLQTGGNILDQREANTKAIQDQMPTYQRLMLSDRVLEAAIKSLPPQHRLDLAGVPRSKWLSALRSRMSVTSARLTNIISVRYVSKHPETAAYVVRAIVDAYLNFMAETNRTNSQEMLVLLTRKRDEYAALLDDREHRLHRLKSESGILLAGGQDHEKESHILAERARQLNVALTEASRKTAEAKAFYEAVHEAVYQGGDIQQFVMQLADVVGREVLLKELGLATQDGYTLSRIEQELIADQQALQTLLGKLGPQHPDILQLQQKIAATQQYLAQRNIAISKSVRELSLNELGPRLLKMAHQRYQQAAAQEQALREQFDQAHTQALALNSTLAEMQRLESEVSRLRKYYDTILDQMKNVDFGAENSLRVQIVSQPRVQKNPVSPRVTSNALLALSLGTLGGMLVVYVLDVMDDRFKSPEELKWLLGLPLLCMIRRMRELPGEGVQQVMTYAQPDSIEAESYRTLRSTIMFGTQDSRRLVMTSTEPGDGKTTTLANLAITFAQARRKTLLIDADMRRPGLTHLLNLKGPKGLSQVLRDSAPVADSCLENLQSIGVDYLDVLPAGPRPANPSELLSSERFNDLLAWAETIYDQILIDAPPVLAVTDPAIIGRLVDGAIIVVRPDKNRRKVVMRAVESYRQAGVNILGFVINHADAAVGSEYGYGYGYGYGYSYGHNDPTSSDEEMVSDAGMTEASTRAKTMPSRAA